LVEIVKSKRQNGDECYLCGALATTKDHIPPLGLFPKPRPSNLITVPACLTCNHNRSLDDEYFRLMITAGSLDAPQSLNVLHQRMIPRMRKSPALIMKFLKSVKKVNIRSEEGIHLGHGNEFQINRPRVQAVIDKIVRGLFFKHTNHRLAVGYRIEDYRDYLSYRKVEKPLQDVIAELPLINIGDGSIFSYRYHISDITESESFWFLMFYNDASFFIVKTGFKSPAAGV
jgi:hypothetical protein